VSIEKTAMSPDPSALDLEDRYARCAHCGGLARPNILMFNDDGWMTGAEALRGIMRALER